MNRTLAISVPSLALLFCAIASADQAVTTFRSSEFNFEVSYPATWTPYASAPNAIFAIQRLGGKDASVVSVHVARFTGDKDEMMGEIRSNTGAYIEKAKARFPDATMVSHGDTFLGSHPAYIYTLSYTIRSLDFAAKTTAKQVFCIRGGYLYQLKLEMTPPSKATDSEFRAIAASFIFR